MSIPHSAIGNLPKCDWLTKRRWLIRQALCFNGARFISSFALTILIALTFLTSPTALSLVCAQVVVQPQRVEVDSEDSFQQRELLQLIRETDLSLQQRNWSQAAERFDAGWQRVCSGEDPLLTAPAGEVQQLLPGQSLLLAGGRSRMISLFQTAPAAFRDEYRRQFRSSGEAQLQQAVRSGDHRALADVAARWRFLPAGQSAVRMLARSSLNRAEFLDATLQLERLRQLLDQPDEQLLLQIAITAWKAGLSADALSTLQSLMETRAGMSIVAGDRQLTLPASADQMAAWLTQVTGRNVSVGTEWTQPLGSYRRGQPQQLGPVNLQSLWSSELFVVSDILFQDQLNPLLARTRDLLKVLATRFLAQNGTVVPVATPLLLDRLLIFRTAVGVRAIDARTGELIWETTHPDGRLRNLIEAYSSSTGSANRLPGVRVPVGRGRGNLGMIPGELREAQERQEQQMLSMNSELLAVEMFLQLVRTNTAGQLSASDRTVFVCEDSAWVTWSGDADGRMLANNRLPANYLRAYDARTGVFRWEAGGQRPSGARVNQLSGFYFLGAPLVLGTRNYVLAESAEGIFLLQIGEPLFRGTTPASANPRILHSQLLAVPRYTLQQHPVRKHAGLMPSYAQGLIICPTCDEHVVAISAEDHSVRWAYRYTGTVRMPELGSQEPVLAGALNPMHSRSVDLNSRWTDSLPRIIGDRVIVTPRDSDQLYCLDLNTGKELFRIARGLSRTVAAVNADILLLTGTRLLTGFSMQDGRLLWTQQIRDGQICGNAAFDDRVIHIPTTAQSIMTFEMATGRRLLTRVTDTPDHPGNLLTVDGLLFSQSLTSVACLGNSESPGSPEALPGAELLLNGEIEAAIVKLKEAVGRPEAPAQVRELLIDVLLESLRTDFAGFSRHIPDLRKLIAETSVDEKQITSALLLMLGMTPGDAAILPAQLDALDRSGKQMDYLFELIVRGLAETHDAPIDQLAESIGGLLPELLSARQRISTSGFLSRRNSQLLVAGIRRAVESRTAEDQQVLQTALEPQVEQLIADARESHSDDSTKNAKAQVQLVRDLNSAGLHAAAMRLFQSASEHIPAPQERLLHEQIALRSLHTEGDSDGKLLKSLWDRWVNSGDAAAVQIMINDLLSSDGSDPLATMKFRCSVDAVEELKTTINEWQLENAEAMKPAALWNSTPAISKSDDSSLWPSGQQRLQGPQAVLPMFGMPGIFRGWSFVQEAESPNVVAYDANGSRRWSFPSQLPVVSMQQTGTISDRYVMATGHLLAVKLHQMLFLLDTSAADSVQAPELLWQVNLTGLHRDEESLMMRQHIPGWERITHYAVQPAGFYPCGPMTGEAIAVISGRRLFVFDTLTGERQWQLDGIPQDAVLLGTDSQLLLLSESERQIEVRDLSDGELISVAPVPEWWIDANENVGASVRDVDVEPGLDVLWRVAVHGKSCLLFRLSSDRSVLELRDITTDQISWSVELPQDSVFSNVAEDLLAVLSDGSQLQIFRIDNGREVTSQEVTPVKAPRELYLRPSQDRLIVLPEAVEDPSLELDPVGSGLHVYGRMYAIDRKSWNLAWDQPLDHRFIRPSDASAGPMLPNAPILVLLSRGPRSDFVPGSTRATIYSTRIVDVATGQDLHREDNVGSTLSYHWMIIDAMKQKLELSFDRHILTFDYGAATDEISK